MYVWCFVVEHTAHICTLGNIFVASLSVSQPQKYLHYTTPLQSMRCQHSHTCLWSLVLRCRRRVPRTAACIPIQVEEEGDLHGNVIAGALYVPSAEVGRPSLHLRVDSVVPVARGVGVGDLGAHLSQDAGTRRRFCWACCCSSLGWMVGLAVGAIGAIVTARWLAGR